MAQYRLNAYDADVYIPEFKGLMQYGDQMGTDLRYSPDCMNVETPGGVLQPAPIVTGAPIAGGQDAAEVGTMMYVLETEAPSTLNQLNIAHGQGDVYALEHFNTFLVAIKNRIFKVSMMGDPIKTLSTTYYYSVYPLYLGASVFSPTSDIWSWCTYEITESTGIWSGTSTTHNIIIMSNEKDGAYWYSNATLTAISTPDNVKFSYVTQYAERIWGCSGDTIYYSRPYSPFDWTAAGSGEQPEDGGGSIRLATFDNDKIVALVRFGDSLIAFSNKRAWRITGTDPSNFYVQEQYGNGTMYPETIAVIGDRIIMLGEHSLLMYDGAQVSPFMEEATHELFRKITYNGDQRPVAMRIGRKYVLSLRNEGRYNDETHQYPKRSYADLVETSFMHYEIVDQQDIKYGTEYSMIIYDEADGTILRRKFPYIVSFCAGTPYVLTYDYERYNEDDSGTMYTWNFYNRFCEVGFDVWDNDTICQYPGRPEITQDAEWTTPWVTLGRKDIQKGGFEVYFTPEIKPKKINIKQLWPYEQLRNTNPRPDWNIPSEYVYVETDEPVTFTFTIETEKKTKVKSYTVTKDKSGRQKRLRFSGTGRRFKLKISVSTTVPWRLVGGIHIIAETDKD